MSRRIHNALVWLLLCLIAAGFIGFAVLIVMSTR